MKVELAYGYLHHRGQVVYITFKDETEIGFFEVRELIGCAEKLSGYKPYFVFADARERVAVTPLGISAVGNKKGAPLCRGTAVLVNSSLLKVAANIFGKFVRPVFPYKAFTNKNEAFEWLYSLQSMEEEFDSAARKRA
ncbi:MAG TPA: hypothetical protein VNZ49_00110 [Bacteroidia bacterium]|jgi:hypothetical protein|nr:hypothetical protein [Bacteroidia bacterium]